MRGDCVSFHSELLCKLLEGEKIVVTFPDLQITASELLEMRCYQALQKIKNILENNKLTDFECVEAIVCLLEDIGSDAGDRHEFYH